MLTLSESAMTKISSNSVDALSAERKRLIKRLTEIDKELTKLTMSPDKLKEKKVRKTRSDGGYAELANYTINGKQ